nr:NB-ARC domains-containing protein [Tanacetum cinerariifolium]
MATTSNPHRWKYDVFVSFRGDDIRKNFMDHMFNDFKQKVIYTFRDDRELPKGEDISPHLYKAIEESRKDKVNMIGIYGLSGIGKTTLAKAIYNLMYVHFDGSCFCEGVSKQQGATQIQMQMIGKIMKSENLKISSVAEGAMVIKQRMSCQRVLLVFDDVENHEQLEAIAGSHTWFCP